MDPTVPAGAALLLDFIYTTETKLRPPECYDVIFGQRQSKLARPLTTMTLAELQKAQATRSTRRRWRRERWRRCSTVAFADLDWRVQLAIVGVVVGSAIFATSTMPAVRRRLGIWR